MGKEFSHFRELRFLNTTTYYCMPIRMARMKRLIIPSAGKDGKLQELSHIPTRNACWSSYFEETFTSALGSQAVATKYHKHNSL